MDKSVPKRHVPKGRAYCDTPGTSCMYDSHEICVNCERLKGWRAVREARAQRRAELLRKKESGMSDDNGRGRMEPTATAWMIERRLRVPGAVIPIRGASPTRKVRAMNVVSEVVRRILGAGSVGEWVGDAVTLYEIEVPQSVVDEMNAILEKEGWR